VFPDRFLRIAGIHPASKLLSVEGLRNLPEQLDWLPIVREGWFCVVLENMENGRAVRAVA